MKKLLSSLTLLATLSFANSMTVYKSPYCGCCGAWVDHVKNNGLEVKTIEKNDLSAIKQNGGITPELSSCHTAFIEGYVIEGHVNYSAIEKLLKEKPKDIIGLTVPGMPIGSPGMEQGNKKDAYNILAIHKDGSTSIYERH